MLFPHFVADAHLREPYQFSKRCHSAGMNGRTPKVITLSCDGMLTATYADDKAAVPQSVPKSSLIVNLDEQNIFFPGYVVPIEDLDGEASISAEGRSSDSFSVEIHGNINAKWSHKYNSSDVGLDAARRQRRHDPLRASLQGP
jgi:hypothetical protein